MVTVTMLLVTVLGIPCMATIYLLFHDRPPRPPASHFDDVFAPPLWWRWRWR